MQREERTNSVVLGECISLLFLTTPATNIFPMCVEKPALVEKAKSATGYILNGFAVLCFSTFLLKDHVQLSIWRTKTFHMSFKALSGFYNLVLYGNISLSVKRSKNSRIVFQICYSGQN